MRTSHTTSWVLSSVLAAFAAVALAPLAGCEAFVDSEIGKGIGEACAGNGDCHTGQCVSGLCTASCTAAADCPAPSRCGADGLCRLPTTPIGEVCASADDCQSGQCDQGICTKSCTTTSECPAPSECFGSSCQVPLQASFIYVGVPEDEGWTLTHDEGRKYAMEQLPYLKTDIITNTFLPDDIGKAADDFIAAGADVVVANSFSQRDSIGPKAEQYPDTQFLVCSSNITGPNQGSYFARSYQAWYLAGYAAAQKSVTKRLGFVGSFVTPEVVRHIDAFTLGARRFDPSVVVEVRWVGFWFDLNAPVDGKYAEERLTEQLLDTGCDVITHNSDTSRTVVTVEAYNAAHAGDDPPPVKRYSVGNDNIDACTKGPTSCIGVPYFNWGPLYVRLFDEIHRKVWDPSVIVNDNILVDPAKSIVNFGMNDAVLGPNVKITVGELLADLAKDPTFAFNGPFTTNGSQRSPSAVAAGETIDDAELATMCWFVEGVVEKTDANDPMSADKPALVPDGTVPLPIDGSKPDCRVQQ